MMKVAESFACGEWYAEWAMEPGEFTVTCHEADLTEDVWADHVRMTETWGRETILSVSLPEGRIVPEWKVLYGAIIVFGVKALP